MGCQQDIASKIIKQEANYVLAVKENQNNYIKLFRTSSDSGKTYK